MLSFSRRASIRMRPTGGLPSSERRSGDSTPWSTALRSRCTNGSDRRSRIERSSSSSAPWMSTSTCLPARCATSRAARGKGSTMRSSRVVRSSSARRWSSPTARSIRSRSSPSDARCSPRVGLGRRPHLAGVEDDLADGREEAVEGLGAHPHGGRRPRRRHGRQRIAGEPGVRVFLARAGQHGLGPRGRLRVDGVDHLGQLGQERRVRGRHGPLLLHGVDHRLERREPAEEQRQLLARAHPSRLADRLHAVLEPVRELGDLLVFERSCHALDGMGHAEHDVDRFHVTRILLQLEQRAADLGEVLHRFLDEDRAVLREIHAPTPTSRGPSRSSRSRRRA